jgi:hypothetical protein
VRDGGHGSSVGVAVRERRRARATPVATVSTTAANMGPSAAGGGAGRNSHGGADCAVLVDQAGANGAHTPAVQRVHGSTPAALSAVSVITRAKRRALGKDQPLLARAGEGVTRRGGYAESGVIFLAVNDAVRTPGPGSANPCPFSGFRFQYSGVSLPV